LQWFDDLDRVDPTEWDALFGRLANPTIYQSRAWAAAWMRHCPGDAQPHLLTVRAADGRLVGLLPLMRARQSLRGFWSRRVLTCLSSLSPVHAQYLGPLIDPGCEQTVLQTLAEMLMKNRAAAHAVYFENFIPGDPVESLIAAIETAAGRRFHRWRGDPTWRLSMPGNLDDYQRVLSPNLRKKLARLRNLLARENGAIELLNENRTTTTVETENGKHQNAHDNVGGGLRTPIFHSLQTFRRFSQARFSSKGDQSSFADPALFAFIADLVAALLPSGRALIFEIRLAGHPIAALLAFHCGRWMGYYNAAFDPAHEKLSPGTLLLDALMREAIARRCTVVDLMAGSDAYKRQWAPDGAVPLHYAALPLAPLRSLPFTLWERLKSRR
jgi:CelD/BcsL family acetyltransferase involved in cellulose biosynthesis